MCTNFKFKPAQDGTIVVGRSMEFPDLVPYSLAVLPTNYQGQASANGTTPGKSWVGTHGLVGIAAFNNHEWLTDGLNDKGVSAHLLYMAAGFCTYQTFKGDGTDVSQVDLIAYLLTTCASVAEVKQAIPTINIWGKDPGMGAPPPTHLLVHDTTASIAIEFHDGGVVRVVDNPTGVATNSPYLDWHLLNLQNYVGFSGLTPSAQAVDGITVAPFGQGQGLNMLPGGYTPPDRFVRAAVLTQLATPAATGADAEQMVGHLLNTFDIVPGTVLEHMGTKVVSEETTYDVIMNLSDLRFVYRTVTDPTWYCLDFNTVDFTKPARTQAMSFAGGYSPITA